MLFIQNNQREKPIKDKIIISLCEDDLASPAISFFVCLILRLLLFFLPVSSISFLWLLIALDLASGFESDKIKKDGRLIKPNLYVSDFGRILKLRGGVDRISDESVVVVVVVCFCV